MFLIKGNPHLVSTYRKFLRLHLVTFIAANFIYLVFLIKSPYILFVLILKPIGYLLAYLFTRPMFSRYDCYFENLGFSTTRLYITISIVDFIAFSTLIAPLKLVF